MKTEKILLELKEIQKNEDILKLNDLIEKLEKQLRLEVAYKGSNRTKIATIKRICNVKHRPILNGFRRVDDKIVFTDSYRLFTINTIDMPIKEVLKEEEVTKYMNGNDYMIGHYPNIDNIMNNYDKSKGDEVFLDINDIMYHYKTRDTKSKEKNLYIIKLKDYEVALDVQYLKEMFDILGTDLIVRANGEYKAIYMENKQGENGILLPIKRY